MKINKYDYFEVSSNGKYIAIISENEVLLLNSFNKTYTEKIIKHNEVITSFAFHPKNHYIVLGNNIGAITLMYCLGDYFNSNNYVESIMHWHSHGVRTMKFTADGYYLMSGGEEAVLVIWQLETRKKSFIPRLGSPIQSISINSSNTLFATYLEDSTIHIITSSDMNIKQTFSGIKMASFKENILSAESPIIYKQAVELIVEPRHNFLVTKCERSLQFYDIKNQKMSNELTIVSRNYISRIEDEKIRKPIITLAVFSANGKWLATVDTREDKYFPIETSLKIWEFNENLQEYEQNTQIDNPHGKGFIYSMKFNNSTENTPLLVTSGQDRKFKVWQLNEPTKNNPSYSWNCRSVCEYKNKKLGEVSFSDDGSILAVVAEQEISLWNPYNNTLQYVLSYSPQKEPILNMHFIPNTYYIVANSNNYLYVWSLLTCSVCWCYRLAVDQLVLDPYTNQFMVGIKSKDIEGFYLLIFDPNYYFPLSCFRVADKPYRSIIYLPDTEEGSYVLYMSEDFSLKLLNRSKSEIIQFNRKKSDENEFEDISYNIEAQQELFNSMFGKISISSEENEITQRKIIKKKNLDKSPFATTLSSHIMVSLSTPFEVFMNNCMDKKEIIKHEEKKDDKKDKENEIKKTESIKKSGSIKGENKKQDLSFMNNLFTELITKELKV
jgi:WD40 repeat protein